MLAADRLIELALRPESAWADKLNPDWTIVSRPNEIKWQSLARISHTDE
jgi:hypothetical protein